MAIPKETIGASFPEAKTVAGVVIKPFTLQHVLALAKMKHPVMTPGQKEITLDDQLVAVAVMGMDPDELAEVLCLEGGETQIRKAAYRAAANIPLEVMGQLMTVLTEQLERGFSTFVPMRREGDGAAVPLPRG